MKGKQTAKAIQLLEAYMSTTAEPSLNAKLSLVNLYLTQGSIGQACEILRQLGHVTYKPAIVSK